jgi:prepilin-type N-terminal cleavage/methylation domain-containing protein
LKEWLVRTDTNIVLKQSLAPENRVESPPDCPSDSGVTLIEILIGIVLLGTVVSATLTGLIAVITAGSVDRSHANAHAWLQTGADMLYARELDQCDPAVDPATEVANTMAEYQATVQQTENPEGWGASNIQVVNVQFWRNDIDASGVGTEAWGNECHDSNLQRVSLRVTSEDGRTVEEVEVIIGD